MKEMTRKEEFNAFGAALLIEEAATTVVAEAAYRIYARRLAEGAPSQRAISKELQKWTIAEFGIRRSFSQMEKWYRTVRWLVKLHDGLPNWDENQTFTQHSVGAEAHMKWDRFVAGGIVVKPQGSGGRNWIAQLRASATETGKAEGLVGFEEDWAKGVRRKAFNQMHKDVESAVELLEHALELSAVLL